MESIKSFFKNKTRTGFLIIVVLVIGYFIYSHYSAQAAPTRYVTSTISKETIVSSVSGTGQVSQDRSVNINPPGSGKLTSVTVKQGDSVKNGQTLAVLDETNNTISLNQARASLASAQASYDQVVSGATSQSIELSKLSMQADQDSLTNASTSLATVTQQQNQNVANALTTLLSSGLQAIPSSGNGGTGTITISGSYKDTAQGNYVINTYNTGGGLEYVVSGLESSTGPINKIAPIALGTKGLYMTFSGNFYNNDNWTVSIPNQLSSNYASDENAYQTALTNQSTAIINAQQQITSAQNKLQQDEINLEVLQQPPTSQQLESAQASLTNAQAQLQNAQITYDNNIIKAPFDGTVAAVNNQAGDQVSASTNIAVIDTTQSIAIIPLNEVDVAKVKVGDKATMTFDAVDGLSITGTVAQIDQIGTVTQGVVNYNVKITFDTEDDRVKPGMSVSVSIITDTQPDVLAVPSSAVQSQGSSSYIQILDPTKTQAVTGQTGVTSSVAPTRVVVQVGASDDTYTQITADSIKEGDTVVTQTINTTATKSTAASATSALRLGGAGGGFGGGGAGATRAVTGGAARGN